MVEGLFAWCGELGIVLTSRSITIQSKWRKGLFGDLSDEGTPGPIPNPEVKLVSADGTWWVTARESRSLPKRLFLSLLIVYFLRYNL
jgi:hypothetical protein